MEHLVDARWLEPPEPLERALAALETLPPGDDLRLLIHREPHLLFRILQDRGYDYRMEDADDGGYEVMIWHKQRAAP